MFFFIVVVTQHWSRVSFHILLLMFLCGSARVLAGFSHCKLCLNDKMAVFLGGGFQNSTRFFRECSSAVRSTVYSWAILDQYFHINIHKPFKWSWKSDPLIIRHCVCHTGGRGHSTKMWLNEPTKQLTEAGGGRPGGGGTCSLLFSCAETGTFWFVMLLHIHMLNELENKPSVV